MPHTARVEALVLGGPSSSTYQWVGDCWYRRRLTLGPEVRDRRVLIQFEAGMNVAEVWLDGTSLGRYLGGYTPFTVDVSELVVPNQEHVLAVHLDNRHSATTGPKPSIPWTSTGTADCTEMCSSWLRAACTLPRTRISMAS